MMQPGPNDSALSIGVGKGNGVPARESSSDVSVDFGVAQVCGELR